MSELWDMHVENSEPSTSKYGHSMLTVSNLEVSSYNPDNTSRIFSTVKKIVRHKVSKRRFKIKIDGKEVIITEDHGLMVYRNNEFIRISPLEYTIGDKIVIEIPKNVSV